MKTLFGLLTAMVLSTCAMQPALACDYPWATERPKLEGLGFAVDELPPLARAEVQEWYNAQPPVSNDVYSHIVFITKDGQSGLLFVVNGCVMSMIPGMTPQKLILLMSRNKS